MQLLREFVNRLGTRSSPLSNAIELAVIIGLPAATLCIFFSELTNCFAMEEPGPAITRNDIEEKALRGLVDAFSPMFSAKEIAPDYSEARDDADAAGLSLYNMLRTSTVPDVHCVRNGDVYEDLSSKTSLHDTSHKPKQANGNSKSSKLNLPPASVGTVSSFLGKDYVRTKPPARRFSEAAKPLILDAELLSISELWVEEDKVEAKDNQMHKEMKDFLFEMLGDGFRLDRHIIGEVLGKCGYDMQKSMEKLFDYSASSLQRRINIRQESPQKHEDSYSKAGGFPLQKNIRHAGSKGLRVSTTGEEESPRKQDRNNLQKEVLAALFSSSERHQDLSSRVAVEKCAPSSLVVEPAEKLVESPEKLAPANGSNMVNSKQDNDDNDEEGSYQALRKAVQEYRITMKVYYTAAIEAFQTGDQVRAYKLLEKGSFFQRKAREADDESAEKIFETSKSMDTQDSMTLDLHEYDAREAIRLLKRHLSSLAGVQAFKYLKVIIETGHEDTYKGARRQRITKLLERDSLEWTEEGTAGTILIPLENIDRRSLSFVKK